MNSAITVGVPKLGRLSDMVRARLDRPAVGAAVAAEIGRAYGVEVAGDPRNIAQGWRSDIVILRTAQGRRVLKAYRSGWPSQSIEHEHSIISELERLDFPAVRLCRTPEGESVVEFQGRSHVMFDFVEGVNAASMHIPPWRRGPLLAKSAEILAQLHQALSDFAPVGHHHLEEPLDRSSTWYAEALAELATHHKAPDDDAGDHQRLVARSQAVAHRLMELEEDMQGASLPQTVIHGDFGLHNLLFTSAVDAVAHDFELARVERRLVDVAIVGSRLPAQLRQRFFEAYRSHNSVPADEWAWIARVWEEYRLRGAVRSWRNAFELGSRSRLSTAIRRIDEAERVRTGQVESWR